MNLRTTGWTGLLAAGAVLLAGCSATSGSGAGTTTAPTGTSTIGSMPAATTTAVSSSSSESWVVTSQTAATGSAGEGQLDARSIAWFSTVCSGITTIQQMKPPGRGTSLNAAGDTLVSTGQSLTQTAQELQSTPAPTFDGADQFAPAAQGAFATVGSRLTELGQQAQGLQPKDQAGGEKFLADYQQFIQDLQQTLAPTLNLQRSVLRSAVDEAPGCDVLAGAAGSSAGG